MKIKFESALKHLNSQLNARGLSSIEYEFTERGIHILNTVRYKPGYQTLARKIFLMMQNVDKSFRYFGSELYSFTNYAKLTSDYEIDEEKWTILENTISKINRSQLLQTIEDRSHKPSKARLKAAAFRLNTHEVHCFVKSLGFFDQGDIIFAQNKNSENRFFEIQCCLIGLNLSYSHHSYAGNSDGHPWASRLSILSPLTTFHLEQLERLIGQSSTHTMGLMMELALKYPYTCSATVIGVATTMLFKVDPKIAGVCALGIGALEVLAQSSCQNTKAEPRP